MPVKKRKPFGFVFQYKGEEYYFYIYTISKDGEYICNCDLTATEYYGNEQITRLCCRVALDAYYAGKADGKVEHKQEVSVTLKDMLGL